MNGPATPLQWEPWEPGALRSFASAGELHLAFADVAALRARLPALDDVLDADERARAVRFVRDDARRRWSASRAFLRYVLAPYAGDEPGRLRFDVDVRGKPSLRRAALGMLSPRRTAALHFNLAHSGDGVLVAVCAAGPVGVDLEVRRSVRGAERLARRFFTPAEAAAVAECDEPERSTAFLLRWTCKEAVLKASGVGIAGGLDAVEIISGGDRVTALAAADESGILSTVLQALSPAPGYLAAVSGPGYDRIVGRRCLPALH